MSRVISMINPEPYILIEEAMGKLLEKEEIKLINQSLHCLFSRLKMPKSFIWHRNS